MNKKITLLILIFIQVVFLQAQKFTISGYIKDETTGESLIGASVAERTLLKGTTTNHYGFYSLTLDKGKYKISYSYVGYATVVKEIVLDKNMTLNVNMASTAIMGKEVEIKAEKVTENVENTKMGTFKIPVEKIKTIPVLFGEVDVLKTIQLTPGVQSGGEGNSSFYVRGGGPDQNLILLDEAVVYNASHLFGFFSVFNADALQNVELTKAGMPANYGGRLSSVLDISMKDGNLRKYNVEGGLGLISSRVTVQGPIKKDTSSFIISGRRTYADIVMKPFIRKTSPFRNSGYYFYDLNGKVNYRLSDKDRFYLSGYFGRDIFGLNVSDDNFQNDISWGNATVTTRWNHLYNPKLFSNLAVIFSDYNFQFSAKQEVYTIKFKSGITDINAKLDYIYLPSPSHTIKFGADYIHHVFTPNNASASSGDVDLNLGNAVKLYSHEGAVYVNDDFDLSKRIKINAGIRGSLYMHTGPFDRFVNDSITHLVIDTIKYDRGDIIKTYFGFEPRFSVRYSIDSLSSVKASATRNLQYIHLASLSSVSLPTDLWFPSTELVKPQVAYQYSLGYYRNIFDNLIEVSLEGYYKIMNNQIEYKEESLPEDNINNNVDNSFTFGKGWSYGAELLINKKSGILTGWIGYTLAKTERKFENINFGNTYPAKYDRRHDVSVVINYQITENLVASAVWVYSTGNTATLPVSRYVIEGNIVNEYGARNSFRMPAYHRGDLSITWYPKSKKKKRRVQESWNFSVYNVYNRRNPYFIYFDVDGDLMSGNMSIKAKQVSLFPVLPSITWNFKF